MFSKASSLKRSSPPIQRVLAANQRLIIARPLFTQQSEQGSTSSPSPSSSKSSSFNGGDRQSKTLLEILRSVSPGVLIAGSTLGYWYLSSSSSFSSVFSFADGPKQLLDNTIAEEKSSKFLFGDAYRRRVFFKYEKRIRTQSPPEKVFEYFASYKSPTGEVLMTPTDLMRAIVPVFPPSESNRVREGFLRGERIPGELFCPPSKFFMLFDTNNDGLISFSEYIFFVTLLSIPESSFSVAFKMFDLDDNGEIDREEFKKVMNLMRTQNRQVSRHRDGRRFGLKAPEYVENGGLLEYFFGKDGNKCLQLGKFVEFLSALHDEILEMEFAHYDYKLRGTISAKDFALSLVASADISDVNRLLDRVDEINESELKDIRITFQEFKAFAELRKKLQSLSLAIFTYGKVNGVLTKKDFQRAASRVCEVSVTDNMVDIIYHVFDANRDGNLSADEFVRVLQRRQKDSSNPRDGSGFKGLLSCWFNCATNCSSSKQTLFS